MSTTVITENTAVAVTAPPKTDGNRIGGDPDRVIRIDGYLCQDCRFVWVCRLVPRQMPYLDTETAPTLSQDARKFAESTRRISSAVETDRDSCSFNCMICRTPSTNGYKAVAYLVP